MQIKKHHAKFTDTATPKFRQIWATGKMIHDEIPTAGGKRPSNRTLLQRHDGNRPKANYGQRQAKSKQAAISCGAQCLPNATWP